MKQKRNTVIMIAVIALIIAAGFLIQHFFLNEEGSAAVITQNGEVIAELSLDTPASITLDDGNGGTNTIVVENHTVYISEANCPDLICVQTGPISSTGEVIACLPHELIITIKSSDSLDSVTW